LKNNRSQPPPWPSVSVIAPCRNEVGFIRGALQSILENDYPADMVEILVLDGMSTDGTREIVYEIMENHPRVRLIDNPHIIVPTAMNIGIKEATGEFIVRIDCHANFSNTYLRKCISVSQKTGATNVGGYGRTLPGDDTPVARAIMLATTSPFGVGNSVFRTDGDKEQEVDTVPFGTFRKSLFANIGLFDERLVRNQDIEMNSRIRKKGGKIIISPEILLSYVNRATLKGLWQQSFNNGLWNSYTTWLTGSTLRIRHFVPLIFVLGVLSLFVGSFFNKIFLAGFCALMTVYTAGALYAAARQNVRTHKTNIALVTAAFFTLHFPYGLGTMWGILTTPFKFPNRAKSNIGQALSDRRH